MSCFGLITYDIAWILRAAAQGRPLGMLCLIMAADDTPISLAEARRRYTARAEATLRADGPWERVYSENQTLAALLAGHEPEAAA
jgi:hypothetical protein